MLFRGWISSFGSKSLISPPNGAIQPAEASSEMRRTPLCRDSIAFQTASRPTPIGETIPTPVMTTSRSATLLPGQPENADDPTKITTEAELAQRQDLETKRRGDKEKCSLAAHSVSSRLRVSLSNSSVFAASPWLILRKCKFNWLAKSRQRLSARPIAGRHNRNHQLKLKCRTTANAMFPANTRLISPRKRPQKTPRR